jgi:uncharacterized coiled-coil protein SlyX
VAHASQGKAKPAASTGFKTGDTRKLEAMQAQVADVNKQLAESRRTLAEMQVQLNAKSELYEKVGACHCRRSGARSLRG